MPVTFINDSDSGDHLLLETDTPTKKRNYVKMPSKDYQSKPQYQFVTSLISFYCNI